MAIVKSFLVIIIAALSACASNPNNRPIQPPVEVEDRIVLDGKVMPLPDEPSIRVESLPPQKTMSPVVQSLMATAQTQNISGDAEAAANSLERALRIEPRNAKLWSQLANVRYAQKNWQQVVQLAAKSNTLAASDTQLRRQNWYLMVSAYEIMGDTANADRYRAKLSR